MSTETNKAIARRLVNAINTNDEAAFLDVLIPDVIDHYSLPGLLPGREGWNMNRNQFGWWMARSSNTGVTAMI